MSATCSADELTPCSPAGDSRSSRTDRLPIANPVPAPATIHGRTVIHPENRRQTVAAAIPVMMQKAPSRT